MATALIAVPAPAGAAPTPVTEALVEQLLTARTRIATLAEAFASDSRDRQTRARRELAGQVAAALAAAADPPDLKLVDQLAARSLAWSEQLERDQRSHERLNELKEVIHERIRELKGDDPALLVKVLERQRAKLEADLASQSGRSVVLTKAIKAIVDELAKLAGQQGGTYHAAPVASAKKRAARRV